METISDVCDKCIRNIPNKIKKISKTQEKCLLVILNDYSNNLLVNNDWGAVLPSSFMTSGVAIFWESIFTATPVLLRFAQILIFYLGLLIRMKWKVQDHLLFLFSVNTSLI